MEGVMRAFRAALLSLALVACSGSSVNVADIVAKIQETCGFVTKWQDIAKVITTIISGFNPDAGDKASVPIGIANTVIGAVCSAVKDKASGATQQSITPTSASVVVNGVPVSGRMVDTSGK
jgi:hypothetical protein